MCPQVSGLLGHWFLPEGEHQRERGSNTHIIGASLDLLVQAVLVLVPEWGVPNQQDVQDDPWGEEQERGSETGESGEWRGTSGSQ